MDKSWGLDILGYNTLQKKKIEVRKKPKTEMRSQFFNIKL